jgi:ABC-type phosphate transport system permease subunit
MMNNLNIQTQEKNGLMTGLGKKVVASLSLGATGALGVCSTVFASTPATPDYSTITSALTGSLNVAQIGAVIAAVLGIGVGLMVFWWGARKLINVAITAFKTGKIKF